ncbi:MAG: hypothetical protein ACW99J_09305, partial [Candidatus Thorarchaeota archaeon]
MSLDCPFCGSVIAGRVRGCSCSGPIFGVSTLSGECSRRIEMHWMEIHYSTLTILGTARAKLS